MDIFKMGLRCDMIYFALQSEMSIWETKNCDSRKQVKKKKKRKNY